MPTSLSAKMWMTSTQALGIASLEEAFMRARILGMWPRGGTWNQISTVKPEGQQHCILYLIRKRRLCSEQAHTGCCHSLQLFTLCVSVSVCVYVCVCVCVCVCWCIRGSHLTSGEADWVSWPNFSSRAIKNSFGLRSTYEYKWHMYQNH